jgi:hypothetical protein
MQERNAQSLLVGKHKRNVLLRLPELNLDDWLNVHRSTTLVDLQLDAQKFVHQVGDQPRLPECCWESNVIKDLIGVCTLASPHSQ